MNHLSPEQMTVKAFFFFFAQETLELAHSTVVWPRWGQAGVRESGFETSWAM